MAQTDSVRESGIEALKIIAIFFIVISHVVQTLSQPNTYIDYQDYVIDLSAATWDPQMLLLSILRYSGVFGNSIFFVCSAWFLLDSSKFNKRKWLFMLIDIWVVSVILLLAVSLLRDGDIKRGLFVKSFFPTTFENNWYLTCYLCFYPIHPILNSVIQRMEKIQLLRSCVVLFVLYMGVNFVLGGNFYFSTLVLWITIYFIIAYLKYYLPDVSNSVRLNLIFLLIGILLHIGLILLTDFLLPRVPLLSTLQRWNKNCNPFIVLIAISLFQLARAAHFKNRIVNYISGLSLLVYVFHENILLRTYYRPYLWQMIFTRLGYDKVLLWAMLSAAAIFILSCLVSMIYKQTVQRAVASFSGKAYPVIKKIWLKIEAKLAAFH